MKSIPILQLRLHRTARRLAVALAVATCAGVAGAGGDHDHGHDHAAPAAAGTASPRLSAHSDLFELVGIVDKGVLTVYLDRHATNEPVTGATVEYESGEHKGTAQPQADGTYAIRLDALAKAGELLPFSFTVSAGPDTDLLAGELDLREAPGHADAPGRPGLQWLPLGAAAAGVAAAAGLALLLARKHRRRRAAGRSER